MSYSRELAVMPTQPQMMDDAKASLSGNWGLAVGTTVVYILVAAASNIVPFGILLLAGPLAVGLAGFFLNIARGREAELGNIFDGFQSFGNALGTYLLMLVAIMVGFMLLVIPGIILSFGLSQSMFILADNPDMGPVDVLKKSWKIMDGHKFDYFILSLRFIGWAILCLFTFGIGYFWLFPYMQTTFANFYDAISGNEFQELEDDLTRHLVDG